jgi:hypothetical protein
VFYFVYIFRTAVVAVLKMDVFYLGTGAVPPTCTLFAVVKKPDIFSPINTGHGNQFSARAVFCRRPEDEHGGVLAP